MLLATFCAPAAYLWTPVPFGLPALLLFGGYLVWWVHAARPAAWRRPAGAVTQSG